MKKVPATNIMLCLAAVGLIAGCESVGRDKTIADTTGDSAEALPSEQAETSAPQEAGQDGSSTLSVSFMLGETGGDVLVSLFADQESWEANDALRGITRAADSARIDISIEDLPPGTYAIKAFHDVNGNGELDTNLVGIPTEPYGFSNGQAGRFGPPSFQAASFELEGEGSQEISMK
ncbi:DUF2141 domain-containing protein [Parvularcula flava]|nr:DUF2141 domain-containing protein [Aquisalinus luteolus]NHK28404.1 DUF2141 domain-containing protein [Aquisalinus luteolus]